jgi:NADH:ubiquinone oxidoreductase subunit 6 (subunit J)
MHNRTFFFKAYVVFKLTFFSCVIIYNFYNVVVGMNPTLNMLHLISMFCSVAVVGGTIALDILNLE